MAGEMHISGFAVQRVASDDGPEESSPLAGMTGQFISNIPDGTPIAADGGLIFVPPRKFEIGEDGQFYEILNDGSVSTTPGINLTAQDPTFELTDPLQWRLQIDQQTIGGKLTQMASWWFNAEAPGWSGSIDELTPVPGVDQLGGTRGIRGYSSAGLAAVAGELDLAQPLVDSADGPVPVGEPINLNVSQIVDNAIAAANIHGQVVAELAAEPTAVAAAVSAVAAAVGPAIDDVISGILNDDTSDIRNFFDLRYAPFSVAFDIGNGTDTVYYVAHNAFEHIIVQLRDNATGDVIGAGIRAMSPAVTRITFKTAPANNAVSVMLQPIGAQVDIEDSEPPTAPGNVNASSITGDSVTITWDASDDNIGVIYYTVWRAPGLGANFASAVEIGGNGLTRTFADTTVHAATNYTYFVTATDFSLNRGPASTGKNVTTAAFVGIDPSSYSGLVSDYDAASLAALANGAAVTSWSPTHGSKTNPLVRATAANQPHFATNAKNSLPALDFDGGDIMRLDADSWSLSKGVIYGVFNATTLANASVAARNLVGYGTYASWGTNSRYIASLNATGTFGAGYGGSGMQAGQAITAGTWYVFVAKFMGGTNGYKLWINNIHPTPTVTGGTAALGAAGNTLLVGSNTAAFQWIGKLAQVGVISCDTTEVPDADCGNIARFLMSKFAITA